MRRKRQMIKGFAAACAACILLSLAPVVYAAGYETMYSKSTSIYSAAYNDNVIYKTITGKYDRSSKTYAERAYTLEYSPGTAVRAVVTSGNTVYGRSSLSTKISGYKSKLAENESIVGGINGSFFSFTTGLPLGLQIEDGIIMSTNSYDYDSQNGFYTVGFTAAGYAVVGQPNFEITAKAGSYSLALDRINAYPEYNLVLLTSDYSSTTRWNKDIPHDILKLQVTSGKAEIGGTIEFTQAGLTKGITAEQKIEDGYVYLVCPSDERGIGISRVSQFYDQLVEAGGEGSVEIVEKSGVFDNVVSAVAGGDRIVNNGEVVNPSSYDSSIKNTLTSRSAIGIKNDGTVVLYALEGGIGRSGGMQLSAVAQDLVNMGCVTAVNLDGGGSTSIAVRTSQGASPSMLNSPQDGSYRSVSNCILVVETAAAPQLVSGFESEALTATSENGATAKVSVESADTQKIMAGAGAAKLDYSLNGIVSAAVFNFKETQFFNPVANGISMYVYGDNSNNELDIYYSDINGQHFYKKVTDLNFEGYKKITLEIANLKGIEGFKIIGSTSQSSIYIDQMQALFPITLIDNLAPTLTEKTATGTVLDGSKAVSFSLTDNQYGTGIDTSSMRAYVNGSLIDGKVSGSTYTATPDSSLKDINKIKLVGSDINGNAAVRYNLYAGKGYDGKSKFLDVTAGKWDSLYINYCQQKGVISGYNEGGKWYYKGKNSITRAEFCVLVVELLGVNPSDYSSEPLPYKDWPDIPNWARNYVRAAYALGIMQGTPIDGDLYFYPYNNITRNEVCVAVNKLIKETPGEQISGYYSDNSKILSWAKPYVSAATAAGLFIGDDLGNFNPNGSLTRSEAAVVISKLLD